MSHAATDPVRGPWAARRARAVELMRDAPHAEELLAFYVGLLEVQERHIREQKCPFTESFEL